MNNNLTQNSEHLIAGKMRLRTTLTSPFGRKVRMAVLVLGLSHLMELVPANTLDETDSLRVENPLGKMPCLVLEDNTSIFDSRVIIEYLEFLKGSHTLIPSTGVARYRTLTAAALCDGIIEAALLMVYERRFRESEKVSNSWLAHQRGKVERGLAVLEATPPDPHSTDLVSINLACALGYLDWRRQVEWRNSYHGLVAWLELFRESEPSFNATEHQEK